jgi:signal transduction histidine kinase
VAAGAGDLRDGELRELIGLALAACRGIARIVRDVAPASLQLTDVNVSDIARAAATSAALDNARVRARLGPDAQVVRGDPIRIRQALDNLIANAIAHSPSERDVVVSVQASGTSVLVEVRDAGDGIAAEHHEEIFEAGFRLRTDQPGSGLGLAVAKAIAEAHAGTLTVESTPGEGATFTLCLPRRAPGR